MGWGGSREGTEVEGGKDAEGPNRMSESWMYSRGTRPILQHDGNNAPLSEIAIHRKLQPIVYGNPTTMGHVHDMRRLGATDLDTGTDKVNPPKNNNYVSQLSPPD